MQTLSNSQTQVQPKPLPPFFKEREGWVEFDINLLNGIIEELLNLNREATTIMKEFMEKTNCEYIFDELPYDTEILKVENVRIVKEEAVDIVVCHYPIEIEFEVLAERLVALIYDKKGNISKEMLVPHTAKAKVVKVNIEVNEGE